MCKPQSLPPPLRPLEPSKSIDSFQKDESLAAATNADATGNNKKSIKRNTSLLSFKSLDFNLKSLYSGLRSKQPNSDSQKTMDSPTANIIRKPPYLKVESADQDEAEKLLQYNASPYHNRDSLSTLAPHFLNTAQPDFNHSSPFLSIGSPNVRRSSTSDIIGKKSADGQEQTGQSRRPSTSDLLRKARERKSSMGRSVSQGGLPRGGMRCGRRTSMAY